MSQENGIGDRVYARLKAEILDAALNPHVRLDVAEIAARFDVSTTPVREAIARLLGEGLLSAHPGGGARPVFPSEFGLRALLDLHARLATLAVDWSGANPGARCCGDQPARAHDFFVGLARAAGNTEFVDIMSRINDRLEPFRRLEPQVLDHLDKELVALQRAVEEATTLKRLLRAYHRRRQSVVSQLIWLRASRHEDRRVR